MLALKSAAPELFLINCANNQLSGALSRLMVVVEKYPDLKSNQNFLALQDELRERKTESPWKE